MERIISVSLIRGQKNPKDSEEFRGKRDAAVEPPSANKQRRNSEPRVITRAKGQNKIVPNGPAKDCPEK